ncbi:DUF3558 family protein [Gordonia sesuvii]|uniref:DUF3558 family protein n=1 Tax=Gordonia sesuvii TaxID=3116777 RepID=UPI003D66BEDC
MRRTLFGSFAFTSTLPLVLAVSACGSNDVTRSESSASMSGTPTDKIRQTDDSGSPLPFANQFPARWNESNDGTSYEPCTAMDSDTADEIGIDFSSVKDAATVSGQTLRGCEWDYADSDTSGWFASQAVADFSSLESYRRNNLRLLGEKTPNYQGAM